MPCNCKCVGSQGGLNLRIVEVDHCPLVCEHIHLQSKTNGFEGNEKTRNEDIKASGKEEDATVGKSLYQKQYPTID